MSLNIPENDLKNINDAPKADYSPLPKGEYCVEVQEVEDNSRVNREGVEYQYIKVKCRVCVGDHKHRVLFGDFIYSHPSSQKAAEIGVQRLKSLYVAAECSGPLTTKELKEAVGKCLKVFVSQSEFNGKVRNELGNWSECDAEECQDGKCGSPEASSQSSDDIFG